MLGTKQHCTHTHTCTTAKLSRHLLGQVGHDTFAWSRVDLPAAFAQQNQVIQLQQQIMKA